ncbi:calcium/sodium antiporter [Quisquiliibacterium transsilvanicum]|uniref:Cation:H+ antiporter n=1 Tax=Quisquiliibacterium transsilvanicum TaxID=1549638 RepID=A0A7W8M8M3_9BURK|nr:calcium/sodium antiporter [Quisquiliibacterium transsilvanicum]MBB5271797.1 cation:H+ antiporter [Quisquiliibacterium transsilvanicum]
MTDLLLFAGGLVALIAGAEVLVRGASRLALSFGLSPLVIGLTVVAFGTSAPEVAVSVGAVLDGRNDIAVGNVVGSNIFNVLGILGLSALVAPLVVHSQVIRQEVPIMIGASLVLVALALDGTIDRLEAGLLLALLAAYVVFLIVQGRREASGGTSQGAPAGDPASQGESADGLGSGGRDLLAKLPMQLLAIAVGLGLLVLGAQWLVSAASGFARALGVSDLVIGLTIVAAGTSLPELATSALAALRGQRDIAVGNVVGSCTFNLLGCLGLAGLVSNGGLAVPAAVVNFDLWVMLAAAIACIPVVISGREIARWEGSLFVALYAAYTAYLILAAADHDALSAYSKAMMSFVIPLAIVTLVAAMLRPHPHETRQH